MNTLLALFMLLTPVPAYHMMRADLIRFLAADQTDKMTWGVNGFGCIGFTETLVRNAQAHGFMAAGIVAYWNIPGHGPFGHEFAQFMTVDGGVVYIEPESDLEYIRPTLGRPLCWESGGCWDKAPLHIITSVMVDP